MGSLNPLNACSRPLGPVADTVSWGLFLLQINSIVFAPAFTGIRTKKYSPHIFVPTHYMKPLDQLGSYLVNELLILWVVVLVQLLQVTVQGKVTERLPRRLVRLDVHLVRRRRLLVRLRRLLRLSVVRRVHGRGSVLEVVTERGGGDHGDAVHGGVGKFATVLEVKGNGETAKINQCQ